MSQLLARLATQGTPATTTPTPQQAPAPAQQAPKLSLLGGGAPAQEQLPGWATSPTDPMFPGVTGAAAGVQINPPEQQLPPKPEEPAKETKSKKTTKATSATSEEGVTTVALMPREAKILRALLVFLAEVVASAGGEK
jgi:hypothetical protein